MDLPVIVGSFNIKFMEPTITGSIYLDMLEHFLQPLLESDGIKSTIVLQKDSAPPHFAQIVRHYLDELFPNRSVGLRSLWAPRATDLTHLDFFYWGFMKTKVYAVKIHAI